MVGNSQACHHLLTLPGEIFSEILAWLQTAKRRGQHTLSTLSLVCHTLHQTILSVLYEKPHLDWDNIHQFGRTIFDEGAPRFGNLVRELNLVNASQRRVQGLPSVIKNPFGTRRYTKLVRHCATHLTSLTAPQNGFGISTPRAAGLCQKLRVLDLHCMSEMLNMSILLEQICQLRRLKTLWFPQDSTNTIGPLTVAWPPNISLIMLAGPADDALLRISMPDSATKVGLCRCPLITGQGITTFLAHHGSYLSYFSVGPSASLAEHDLNSVLSLCPNLVFFEGYLDYMDADLVNDTPFDHPLDSMLLHATPLYSRDGLDLSDFTEAIQGGRLSHLVKVEWTRNVPWSLESPGAAELLALLDGNHPD